MLREKLLGQPPHLNVVAAQPGQILHKHGGGLAGGKLLHHVVETGAVHRDAGDAVVQEVDQVGVSFFLRHLGQQFLLVADAVTLALQVVIAGKPLIEERGHITGFTVVRLSHSVLLPPGQPNSKYNLSMFIIPPSAVPVSRVREIYFASLSDFISRRRMLPRVSGPSCRKTGSTTNDLLPKR